MGTAGLGRHRRGFKSRYRSMEVSMLTKGRVSLIIAAGGLLLVGLLAAALFVPSSKDEGPATVGKKAEKTVKMEAVVNPANSLAGQMGAPNTTATSSSTSPTTPDPRSE